MADAADIDNINDEELEGGGNNLDEESIYGNEQDLEGMLRAGVVESFDWTPERVRLAGQILVNMELPELFLNDSYFDANQDTFSQLMQLLAEKPEFKSLRIYWDYECRMAFVEDIVAAFPPKRLDRLKLYLCDEFGPGGDLTTTASRETLTRLVQIPRKYLEFFHFDLYMTYCLPSLRACLAAFDQGLRRLREEEEGEDYGPYIKTDIPFAVCEDNPDSQLAAACKEYDVLSHLEFSVRTKTGISSLSTVASLTRLNSLDLGYYCFEELPGFGFEPFRLALAANETLEELKCWGHGSEQLDFITRGVLPALSSNGTLKKLKIVLYLMDGDSHDYLPFFRSLRDSMPLFRGLLSFEIFLYERNSGIAAETKDVLTEAIRNSLQAGLQQNTSLQQDVSFHCFGRHGYFYCLRARNQLLQSVREFVPPTDHTECLRNSFVTKLCSIVAEGQEWGDDEVYVSPVVELVRRWLPEICSSSPSFWENAVELPAESVAVAAARLSPGQAEESNVATTAKRRAQESTAGDTDTSRKHRR